MTSIRSIVTMGISALLLGGLSEHALATPHESATFLTTDSNQGFNNAGNVIRTATFTGGYAVRSIRVTGSVDRLVSTSGLYEARILVTPPTGRPFILAPGVQGYPASGTGTFSDQAMSLPEAVPNAAGLWSFRFFELNVDSTTTPDANWPSVTFTLDDDLAPGGTTVLTPSAGLYTEVEPNDNPWGGANLINNMQDGEQLTGNSTGLSLGTPGSGSVDNYIIRTAAAPLGIYRYRMALTTAVTGHSGAIRGYGQSSLVAAGQPGLPMVGSAVMESTLVALATGATTTPPRYVAWYAFGRQERTFYRVNGSSASTSDYVATFSRSAVTPVVVATPLIAGSTVFARGSGTTANLDMWLFDANLNAIPDGGVRGNTSPTPLTRSLAAGTYYLAVANSTVTSSSPSPADSTSRTGNILIYPDSILNTSTTANVILNIDFNHPGGTVSASAVKAEAFDIVWYQFSVVPPSAPAANGAITPNTAAIGRTAKITVNVTPANTLPNTFTSVTVDASSIGLGTVALNDSGQNGDVTAGDRVWSRDVVIPPAAPQGEATITFVATDAGSRTASGSIVFLIGEAPSNDSCLTPTVCSVAFPSSFDTTFADTDGPSGTCNTAGRIYHDVWFTFTAPATGGYRFATCGTTVLDTTVAVYDGTACPTGAPLACNDNSCGSQSRADLLSAVGGHEYLVRVGGATPVAYGSGGLYVTSLVFSGPVTNPSDNASYYLLDQGLTWTSAESLAVLLGGHLASIHSIEENEWLRSNVALLAPSVSPKVFIGLNDVNQAPNIGGANYQWSDGSTVTFTNWALGEPNDNLGFEHWAEMNGLTGEWSDVFVLGSTFTTYAAVKIPAPTLACSLADITGIGGPPSAADGLLTGDDFNAFINAFAEADLLADVTGIGGPPATPDGLITGDDFNAFIAAFAVGCP